MNWFDRFIAFVSPTVGMRRARARAMTRVLQGNVRKYEGAAKGRRMDNWITGSASANAEIGVALASLRDRSRDLVRNNPYAARAVSSIAVNTVGTGIIPQAKGKPAGKAKLAAELWMKWGETPQCDADGNLDFYGLQALVARTVAESGECLIRRRKKTTADGLSVPLQLQVLEGDFIDSSQDTTLENGNQIIQGVEFDKSGKRVAYYLFTQHPGDKSAKKETIRIDAADILHIYRKERAGQVRGVPWAAPVMVRLHDFDEYEDAQLMKQKVSACYTAFVQDMQMPEDLETAKAEIGETLEPGTVEILPSGKTISFANPPAVTGYGEYASAVLHAVAAGFGVPYESLTGDYSQVNFSSGRMGWLEFQRNIEQWRWSMLIPQLCLPVWSWFVEAATVGGSDLQGVTSDWTPPRREMIDPTREVPATISAVRAGLMSLSQAVRETGYDPETHLKQCAEDNKLIDKLGLVLDSDPRKTMKAGIVQSYLNEVLAKETMGDETDET